VTPEDELGTVPAMSLAARDHPVTMTAEEFLALPEQLPRAQLIDGELIVVNTPAARHNRIIFWLVHSYMSFANRRAGLGELAADASVLLDERNVYVPDLYWVPDDRRLDDTEGLFTAPPPLVVEVRSPSTWRYDVGTKLRHYEAAGVAEAWLIDGEAGVVHLHRRSTPEAPGFDVRRELTAADTLTTPLVPGWEIDLGDLFGS